jgi:SAM-dependent methyltransferase
MKPDKFILDACCGGRMFWFEKHHPNALYVDIRKEPPGTIQARPNFNISPDEIGDFRNLRFEDKSFKLVVFDPPHFPRKNKSIGGVKGKNILLKKYGELSENWKDDLEQGFSECWRVLDDYGVLIFKWTEVHIPLAEILELTPVKPLFGHKSGKKQLTHWLCFMKIPPEAKK